jgi:hypothetical protein
VNALTEDGLVHRPSAGLGVPQLGEAVVRGDRPTTACGRAEQVYVVTDNVTCPLCGDVDTNRALQDVANEIRAEWGLPPLDPPNPITGFQRR